MADTFTTITGFINSPPGRLAAGGVLGGIVWKFFKHVGDALNEQTNREIARWLRVKHFETGIVTEEAVNWPGTFAKVFDRVFGEKHLSWKCFRRAAILSLSVASIISIIEPEILNPIGQPLMLRVFATIFSIPGLLLLNVVPDYVSLLETRYILKQMERTSSLSVWILMLLIDATVTLFIAAIATAWTMEYLFLGTTVTDMLMEPLYIVIDPMGSVKRLWMNPPVIWGNVNLAILAILPASITSIWLWLYAASGFLLKAAHRFDIGFDWFNRRFDIEKKPLQSMGLVAGALVAVMWWAFVIVRRFM